MTSPAASPGPIKGKPSCIGKVSSYFFCNGQSDRAISIDLQ